MSEAQSPGPDHRPASPEPDPVAAGRAHRVVVGIDGSAAATHALAWVLSKRHLFGPVLAVTTFQPPATRHALVAARTDRDARGRAKAEKLLDAAVSAADTALRPSAAVLEGQAGPALVEQAGDADLLVVGTRGHGRLASALLGSVSSYCVTHADCPVVVVPPGCATDRPLMRCVVGIDGSEGATKALQWAVDHVEPDGTIHAVGGLSPWNYMSGHFDPPLEVLQQDLLDTVEHAVGRVTGAGYEGPEIRIKTVTKTAGLVLRGADAPVDLLVVGAGERSRQALAIGSVAATVAHRPNIPTVIVPS